MDAQEGEASVSVADQKQQDFHDQCVSHGLISWLVAHDKDDILCQDTTSLAIASHLSQAFLKKPNDAGEVLVTRRCILNVAKYLHDQHAVAIEALAESLDDNSLFNINTKTETIICGLKVGIQETEDSNEVEMSPQQRIESLQTEVERLQVRNEYLENELRGADEDIEELNYALQETEEALASQQRGTRVQSYSRGTKRRTRDAVALNTIERHGSTSSESISVMSASSLQTSTSTSTDRASASFHTVSMNEYISRMRKKNGKFLQLLAQNTDDVYTFGHCSACAAILHAICNASDLSHLERMMQMFAIIWDTDMAVTRNAKERIVCVDMKGPLSLALKALVKSVLQDKSEDSAQYAALVAYNKYCGTAKSELPSIAYTTAPKIDNNIMIAMFVLVGIRVSKNISLHHMDEGKLTDPVRDAERKQDIIDLIDFIVEITGARPNESVTIAWIYMHVLVPACDSTSQEIRLRMIKCINFLIEEMQHLRYIEVTVNAEIIAMTKLADNVDSFELAELREKFEESLYICERKDVSAEAKAEGKKGGFKATWRRKAVAKVFFASLYSKAFARRAVESGLLREEQTDVFTFGVMNEAISKFHRKDRKTENIPLDFLFDVENYTLGHGNMTSLAGDIKQILDTATKAMKQFEQETHFAEPKFQQYYEEFFKSMSSTEETDSI